MRQAKANLQGSAHAALEPAHDLLDEQMQQSEAAADFHELVDELRLQKAWLHL